MKKIKEKVVISLAYVITTVGAIYFFFPIYWMVWNSINPWITKNSPLTSIFEPTFSWYELIFTPGSGIYIGPYLTTSLIITLSSTTVIAVLGSLGAYGLTKLDFRFRDKLTLLVLSQRLLPTFAFLIPLWLLYRYTHLYDTMLGLIIAYIAWGLPFFTWLMLGFFSEIPKEIEESAMVDGLSRLRAFWFISLPFVVPGLAVVSILTMIFIWNDFLLAITLTERNVITLPIALTSNIQGISAAGAASALIMSLPMMIAGTIIQRYLVRGLTFGTVRG
ncbi:MAG: carbohydrate ABC transporter permease [Nitrososphaeria archaeon]